MKGNKKRTLRMGGFYLLLTALSLLALVLGNLVMEKLPQSWTQRPMTDTGLLRLDAQTRTFVQSLNKDVTICWIVRGGQEDVYLERLLAQLEELSPRLHVEKTDPVLKPGVITQYTSGTVNQNSLVLICGENSRYVDYTSIYLRESEDDSSANAVFDGEGAICTALRAVTSEQTQKLYLLTGHAEPALPERFAEAIRAQGVEIAELSLLASGGVPDDCSCLLVTGAETDLTDTQLSQLDAYLRAGGRMCLFTRYVDETTPNWNALLAGYGLSGMQGLVVEAQSGRFAADYPYYLLPQTEQADATAQLLETGLQVLIPLTQPVQIAQALPQSVSCQSLLRSSASSYSKREGFAMQQTQREDADESGPFTLGVSAVRQEQSGQSALCWFPSAYILNDTINDAVSDGNLQLLLSVLGWLTDSGGAPVPAGKKLGGETLTLSKTAADVWSVVLIAAVPLAVVAGGAVVIRRRKRR